MSTVVKTQHFPWNICLTCVNSNFLCRSCIICVNPCPEYCPNCLHFINMWLSKCWLIFDSRLHNKDTKCALHNRTECSTFHLTESSIKDLWKTVTWIMPTPWFYYRLKLLKTDSVFSIQGFLWHEHDWKNNCKPKIWWTAEVC